MSKKTKRQLKQPIPTGKLQLLNIRLLESASRLGDLKPNQLPGYATQAINAAFAVGENDKAAFVKIRIRLDASYDGDKTKEPVMSIVASFVASYSIVEDFSDKNLFQKFTQQLGMNNIWPYWREFVQSTTTRMGLPAFPVPLINVTELKMSEDGGDE